jgi:hypothetical protein
MDCPQGGEQMSSVAGLLPDIERRRLRALVKADTVTAAPLHADDYCQDRPE